MNQEKVKKVILDSKLEIEEALARDDSCLDYLSNELGKTSNYIEQFIDLWQFAFDNVSNWDEVIKKYSCETQSNLVIENFPIPIQINDNLAKKIETVIPIIPNKSKISKTKVQNSLVEYKVIEESIILVEFYNKEVYGSYF